MSVITASSTAIPIKWASYTTPIICAGSKWGEPSYCQLGAPYSSIEDRGLFFPVAEVSSRYLKSARFDDEIAVETYVQEIARASIVFGYKILRKNDGALLVEGWTRHACLDRLGK